MAMCSRLIRALALLASLVVANGAFAQFSPIGQWECSVSGRMEGVSTRGTAYVEFQADGTVSGFALLRNASDVYELQGTWELGERRVSGIITASPDDGLTEVSFVFSGTAREGLALSVRCTSEFGDRLSLSGRSPVVLPDVAGDYVGTFRSNGVTGIFQLTVNSPAGKGFGSGGLLEVSGSAEAGGQQSEFSGWVIIDRRGSFVLCMFSSSGSTISLSGTFRAGRPATASGMDLTNGGRVSVRFE